MVSGVVEVVAHLGSAKGGFRYSSAARAVVNQGLAQPRAAINAQRDVILRLNIDVALMTEELKGSTYA